MTFLRKVFSVFYFRLRQTFTTPKNIMLFLMAAIFIWGNVQPIGDFAEQVGIKVRPWVFCHLTNDYICQLIFSAICVALFCDAPWNNDLRDYIVVRSGKRAESAGHIVYIAVLSLIYVLFLFVVSILVVLPKTEFADGWGKVLGTLARTNAGQQVGLSFSMSDYLIGAYSPVRATCLSLLLEWACFTWLGLCIYLCNKHIGRMSGIFVSVAFILLDLTAYNDVKSLYRFSPISLAQLTLFQRRAQLFYGVNLTYAAGFFSVGITAMSVAILVLSRRKNK